MDSKIVVLQGVMYKEEKTERKRKD